MLRDGQQAAESDTRRCCRVHHDGPTALQCTMVRPSQAGLALHKHLSMFAV